MGKGHGGEEKPNESRLCMAIAGRGSRRVTARCRLFSALCLLLSIFIISSHVLFYRTLWSEGTLVGDNLEATPWQPHNDTISSPSLWDKLGRVRTAARCSSVCRPPLHVRRPETRGPTCPTWFQYIHKDLELWQLAGGIRPADLKAALPWAAFRATIVGGRLYANHFYKCPGSRSVFTLWGLATLLRRFPGQVPDVDLLFDCTDRPVAANTADNATTGSPQAMPPREQGFPLIFSYSSGNGYLDVPFPDWSFWGLPEGSILPWEIAREAIQNSTRGKVLSDRPPTAQFKGHLAQGGALRSQISKCGTIPRSQVEVQPQDAELAIDQQHATAHLVTHCSHRYKIFGEGDSWSIGLKYALACGSVLLLPEQNFYDFYSRGLVPARHFIPVQLADLCQSVRFAVNYGNFHQTKAAEIAAEAERFVKEDISMAHVQDYMLHLLTAYGKLQRFKPQIPKGAKEICPESILCFAEPWQRPLLEMEQKTSAAQNAPPTPCHMPLPYSPEFDQLLELTMRAKRLVAECEKGGLRNAKYCEINLSK